MSCTKVKARNEAKCALSRFDTGVIDGDVYTFNEVTKSVEGKGKSRVKGANRNQQSLQTVSLVVVMKQDNIDSRSLLATLIVSKVVSMDWGRAAILGLQETWGDISGQFYNL
ncbi:hypothetical protein DPMN_099322 [Dreissena polymorpha]|uniref:Uncharacterized protein n=1 Tax=Dreissena polymorpha TaxID=45954 RepID=A0A9D4LF97_DREPO|nr:hypothetical protein DPMN_099322 [Dreissena polymorpha]